MQEQQLLLSFIACTEVYLMLYIFQCIFANAVLLLAEGLRDLPVTCCCAVHSHC